MAEQKEDFIWAERYRPQTLDGCIIPDSLKTQLKDFLKDGQIPNLLFHSPSPGTGKTTTAKALCNDLGIRPLFINASLNNSIDDIRMSVTQYATTVSLMGDSTKVVILDECERLSPAAQESLKGLIEHVHRNCRFILTCNTKSRVIDPLRSRCIEIDFVYSAEDQMKLAAQMMKRSFEILDENNISYKKPVVAAIIKKLIPDNRRILQTLQRFSGSANGIDEGVLGFLASGDTSALVTAMREKKYSDVKQWCFDNHDRLSDEFYGGLYKALQPLVVEQSDPEMVLAIEDSQRYHTVVADRFLHYLALCTELMMSLKFKGN